MSKEDMEDVDKPIDLDEVKRRGDAFRKYLLSESDIKVGDTAPSSFRYQITDNSIGLNEISNVDMGYAKNMVDSEHVGKRRPYLHELERNVQLMLDSDNSIVVLNGGLFTYVPKSRNGQLLSYGDQLAYFYSLFKDLAKAGKIVAMVRGTEEHRILKNHGIDVLDALQKALELDKKVCNDALVKVRLEDDMVPDPVVGIRTINWNNTATTTSYIGRTMEKRATLRDGADIYLARTTKNFFKTAISGATNGSDVEKRPIYLISAGPYTPFKGAMTAGAEYNSIKDGELAPNSFWYKVTVEPRTDGMPGRPYIVRVNPVQYQAHQVTEYSTDKTTAAIVNLIESGSDDIIRYLLDRYPQVMSRIREDGARSIREVLLNNRKVAERNALIKEFLKTKKSGGDAPADEGHKILDFGSNVDGADSSGKPDADVSEM